jgi:hypothetical protein
MCPSRHRNPALVGSMFGQGTTERALVESEILAGGGALREGHDFSRADSIAANVALATGIRFSQRGVPRTAHLRR